MDRSSIIVVLVIFFGCAAVFAAMPLSLAAEQPWDVQDDLDAAKREVEYDEIGARRGMGSTIYGEVLRIDNAANSMSVREGSDGKKGSARTYFINPGTTFTIVSSIRQLYEGDYVTVDYYSFKGKRFADSVLLEKRGHKQKAPRKPKADLPKILVD